MQASMLEIYNEDYKDLLAKKKLPDGKQHKVRAISCQRAKLHPWMRGLLLGMPNCIQAPAGVYIEFKTCYLTLLQLFK